MSGEKKDRSNMAINPHDLDLMGAPSPRVRFWVAVPLTILGGLFTVLGGWGVVLARLTGHLDPYHGGTMLFDASVGTLIFGLALLGAAFYWWPRRQR